MQMKGRFTKQFLVVGLVLVLVAFAVILAAYSVGRNSKADSRRVHRAPEPVSWIQRGQHSGHETLYTRLVQKGAGTTSATVTPTRT